MGKNAEVGCTGTCLIHVWDTLSRQRMIRDLHTFLISGRRKSFKKSRNLAVINFKMSELKSVALFSSSLGCAIVFFVFCVLDVLVSWFLVFVVQYFPLRHKKTKLQTPWRFDHQLQD